MPKVFSEQEKEILYKKLLAAGLKALQKKPYRMIIIDDIAAEVGIAKGTFYHFFSSKEAFFYEIMQQIKEKNRKEIKELLLHEKPSREEIVQCLFHRYTKMKTVYDYFSVEEMKKIVRKLPNEALQDDSVEFATWICNRLSVKEDKASILVNLCNILALASSNRDMLEKGAYETTIRFLCQAIAEDLTSDEEVN